MADNSIYYNPILLASVMKRIGSNAARLALADELGHTMALQREGLQSGLSALEGPHTPQDREAYADCAGGAIAARAQQLGLWSPGAQLQAGRALAARSEASSVPGDVHGSPGTRLRNFDRGYHDGAGGIGFCELEHTRSQVH